MYIYYIYLYKLILSIFKLIINLNYVIFSNYHFRMT